MRDKHGTQLLRTPPDILIAFFKAWDEIAQEESAKNPFFKKVLNSQRAYASKVVPAKRFMFPPYCSRRTITGPKGSDRHVVSMQ
jgi:TRAP-type mannitol/chloroaromatic compound transport system substrate-binding protein